MTARRSSLRVAQQEQTRALLVRTAIAAFQREGYAATSIGQITAEADVNRATFYLHFSSKAEIMVAAAEQISATQLTPHWRSLDAVLSAPTAESIERWLVASTRYWLDHATFRNAWYEAVQGEQVVHDHHRDLLNRHLGLLKNFLSHTLEPSVREDRLRVVVLLILQLDGLLGLEHARTDFLAARTEYLDLLTESWLALLRPRTSAIS